MDVTPIFADSLGAKSFCVRVDTDDTSVLVDPGAAPFPKDHPTMSEEDKTEALLKARDAISDAADGVDHLVISHWHGDHYTGPDEGVDLDRLYGGRTLWVKDPRVMINPGQKRKAHRFFEALVETFGGDYVEGELPRPRGLTVRAADDAQVVYEDTVVAFSRPLPHGPKGSSQGYVVACSVRQGGGTFVHSSDVQGPGSEAAETWIRDQEPTHLALDGPPTYLIGRYDVTEKQIEKAFERAVRLLGDVEPSWTVYDHHLCREPGFRERCPDVWEAGARTVAELLGR